MKRTILFSLASFCLATPAMAVVIDDFDTPGLSEYTFSKVLDQGTVTNLSYSDANGTIDVTSTGADGAEQVLLLHNTQSLVQGMELQLDAPTAFNNRDFGLAIGAAHTDLGDGVSGDNRTTADYIFIAWRTLTFLNSRGFIGNAEIALNQFAPGSADKLFIARTDTDQIELGYYEAGVRNVSRTETPVNMDIFDHVGFYSDIRTDGNGFSGADNLAIVSIPVVLLGDTDGDGDIDDFDLINAIVAYTGSLDPGIGDKTIADGDTDGDGDVDDFDLINMIVGYTGSLSAPAVPEPASLALLSLGGLLVASRRRG